MQCIRETRLPLTNTPLNILVADPFVYSTEALSILSELGQVTVRTLTRSELLGEIEHYQIVVSRLSHRFDADFFLRASRLRAIVTNTTGLDHVDLRLARSNRVEVISLFGEGEFLRSIVSTAELTWALLLNLSRNLPQSFAHVRDGGWDRNQFLGFDLQGKTLGIVGLGRIGQLVARFAACFGMTVLYTDIDQITPPVAATYVPSLAELFALSDAVSIHVPLNEKTKCLITAREFEAARTGLLFINTSRGGVVDEAALLRGLVSGKIKAAALDVLDGELEHSTLANHALIEFARTNQNLLISPHLGGASIDSWHKTEVFVVKKLRAWLNAA